MSATRPRAPAAKARASLAPLRWDRLLTFIGIFQRPGFDYGQWAGGRDQFACFAYSPEVDRFVKVLYDDGWIVSFDWMHWQRGKVLYDHPDRLARARTRTLRRLLTAHVPLDRFSEGHLATVLEDGHILAILRRLAELRSHARSANSQSVRRSHARLR